MLDRFWVLPVLVGFQKLTTTGFTLVALSTFTITVFPNRCAVAIQTIHTSILHQLSLYFQQLLFNEADLERTLFRLSTEPIGKDFEPLPGLKVRFINAGHIVGAVLRQTVTGARYCRYLPERLYR